MSSVNTFSPWDYVVFAGMLVISASIGLYYGCFGSRQSTTREFLMANRSMGTLPVALSLLASFMSAITLLGTPAEVYTYGTQYWVICVGYVFTVPMAAHVFLPIFYNLGLTSVFEYLEMRYSRAVRTLGALTFVVQMTLYMAIVLYAPSLALSAVTGLNVWISVFSVGVVCTFYTSLGGIKAVMWTDVFQITIMFAGLVAILVQGSSDHGGFGEMWQQLEDGQRVEFLNWDPDPTVRHSVWSLTIGGGFTWLAIYGVNQAQVQRALTTTSLRKAQAAMWVNLPGLCLLLTICSLCGVVVYADFKDCDPLDSERITAKDQLLPLYVMDRLSQYPGVPGLFTACLFSGALSTISSGLNSLAAVILQDLLLAGCAQNISSERQTLVSKIVALVFGIVCIALTFVAAQLGGVLQAALALFGMIGGPILGIYTVGIIYPFVNTKAAYVSFTVSIALTLWLGIGANVYKPDVYRPPTSVAGCVPPLNVTEGTVASPPQKPGYFGFYEISYMWYSFFAVAVVHVVAFAVSAVTGGCDREVVDPKLHFPFWANLFFFLPRAWRRRLRFGVEYETSDLEKAPPAYFENPTLDIQETRCGRECTKL